MLRSSLFTRHVCRSTRGAANNKPTTPHNPAGSSLLQLTKLLFGNPTLYPIDTQTPSRENSWEFSEGAGVTRLTGRRVSADGLCDGSHRLGSVGSQSQGRQGSTSQSAFRPIVQCLPTSQSHQSNHAGRDSS
ncbi:hypothetical protein PGTUg99_016898 [Puccinia graminis f. sp. tritici]|uniref:Uncharacterized protein n=1 Tax=Puccinia graminis f. sp. tritici TaxID=56615 RepID=A0A5B0NBV7_PUCGR|nr:hypothetical protein PGTUg99_016898 [Puccinia graminis f. sp. tritici]